MSAKAKHRFMTDFQMFVVDADGPKQLRILDARGGLRLLGGKGSPYIRTLAEWNLSREEVERLVEDLNDMLLRAPAPIEVRW